MFAPYCPRHDSVVLLPTSAITSLVSGERGIVAHFTCHCGAKGIWAPERVGRAS